MLENEAEKILTSAKNTPYQTCFITLGTNLLSVITIHPHSSVAFETRKNDL